MKKITLLLILMMFTFSCGGGRDGVYNPPAPDYNEVDMWYGGAVGQGAEFDVFYILPTCVFDWQDEYGAIHHFADVTNHEQRESCEYSYDLAKRIFASNANFFAPYYRHITLESWGEGEEIVEQRFDSLAMVDIRSSFNHFLSKRNSGRPFVLAGFSQGAKGVVELLKEMPSEVFDRMIAAYVIGYKITNEDLNECETIIPATSYDDCGVVVSYNSVASLDAVAPIVSGGTVVCINPVNWSSLSTPVLLKDGVEVRVDTQNHILIVEGLDSTEFYYPELNFLFKLGNYHLQELHFYEQNLRENVAIRYSNFKK